MRPLRLLLSLTTSLLAVTLLLFVALGGPQDEQLERTAHDDGPPAARPQSSFATRLSFTSPTSLFPPSAIISLTDDNSTFFLARPAAFGPLLPNDGLSSPLWIGAGFGDDALGQGELGCSDIPGWDRDSNHISHATEHVGMHSRQDCANMTGKVALLKRGGCGFLAKIEWAQRRGAVAVIVGDNVRGGGLIRMYAQGDTSNVTIPSLFTSHTTAHLLSSLLPSGSVIQGLWPDEQQRHHGDHHPTSTHSTEMATPSLVLGDRDPSVPADTHGRDWVHSLLSAVGLVGDDDSTPSTTTAHSLISDKMDRRDLASTSQARPAPTPAADTRYTAPNARQGSWTRWFSPTETKLTRPRSVTSITGHNTKQVEGLWGTSEPHEGLWVTLTPTDVSSSPFFDTLLVLVVSPLVTLSVVYALLLLRSRIRRRRWRAPKSVVERLPVRTYQTISDPSSSPSTTSEVASPTTPLLQRSPTHPIPSASRPQSETDPGAPTASSIPGRTRDREEEKRGSGLAEWRRRYGGRQKECVVCLEEYVDGVSQVMSLPCGHEFHVECITPWLVTRRRTCPICKGDVVRSLSQDFFGRDGSPSSTPRLSDDEGVVDALQIQAAETHNSSPSSSRPLPIAASASIDSPAGPHDDVEANWPEEDVHENARDIPGSRVSELSTSVRDLSSTVSTVIWRGFEVVRSTTGLQRRPPPEDVDRDR